jgi:hypothetical protein
MLRNSLVTAICRVSSWLLKTGPCGAASIVVLACCFDGSIKAQQTNDKWKRVYTGEDSVIDINAATLRFEHGSILRAGFRTILSKPQKLEGPAGAKFKSRLETIDFKASERRYRVWEASLRDSTGQILLTTAQSTDDWRIIKAGGVIERLFNALRALPPFGGWKVAGYRYADRTANDAQPSPELERLVGTRVRFEMDSGEVGTAVCNALVYEGKRTTKDELFRQLGIELESLGIRTDRAEMINLRCDGNEWTPSQSLLLKVKQDEMLMLWKGVFLVLKRERQWTGDILPPLKRDRE